MAPKKKVNRADFMFTQKNGETLVKQDGQLEGAPFNIRFLEDCTVHLLDHTAQVTTSHPMLVLPQLFSFHHRYKSTNVKTAP